MKKLMKIYSRQLHILSYSHNIDINLKKKKLRNRPQPANHVLCLMVLKIQHSAIFSVISSQYFDII